VIFEATKEGDAGKTTSKEQVMLYNMAIGHSIIEIKKTGGLWKTMTDSALNRRITLETEFTISGTCAGHDLMKTSCDPGGAK
jgi:secreted PhoX family phosphatase